MKSYIIALFLLIACNRSTANKVDTLKISPDIYLLKLNEQCYIHTSYFTDSTYGRFGSNGMIVINKGKAALFDTPMSDSLTRKLVHFIEDSLKSKIEYFVPNHWHDDCTEGIDILDSIGAKIISSEKTKEISKEKKIITAYKTFTDTMTIDLSGKKILLNYLGEAHSTDNIVVWIADEKILFGGCMIKAMESNAKGNVADANLVEWPKTLKKVKKKFGKAKIIIPGHGNYGNSDLINHSIKIISYDPKEIKCRLVKF
jgi:metallo-beta-lactamase class B